MKSYSKNPRKISEEQREALKESLRKFGDLGGIVHELNSDEIIGGNQRGDVFDINQCEIVIEHKNKKPDSQGTVAVEIFARPMRNHTKAGDVCLEPFAGSGSQILAGQQEGRVVYACEIEPAFAAVALQRFEDATGITPKRLETRR